MKKILTMAVPALLCGAIYTNAQPLTAWGSTPSDSERFVHSVSDDSRLNCANITFRDPLETGENGQLGVICWEQGASGSVTPGFYVFDDAGHHVTTSLPSADSKLDVIIGDGVTAATPHVGDYRVGVVYLDASNDVMVNIYDVTGAGTAGLAVTFVSTTTVASGTYDDPRIDIIAEHNVTTVANLYSVTVFTPGSRPNCSKYIVTYDDASGNVYGYENDLNVPFTTPLTVTFPPPSGSGIIYSTPDVAAIQRNVSLSIHDYAIFTWVDNVSDDVYEAEWDCNTSGTTSPTPVFMTGGAGTDIFCHPRNWTGQLPNSGGRRIYTHQYHLLSHSCLQ